MGEQGRLETIEVKITEKADAVPRERIRAVGMCFYTPVRELVPGNSYRLCRNPQNPRDVSCIEIKHGTRVRATLNKDVAKLLSPYLDSNTVEEPTWWVSFFCFLLVNFFNALALSERFELWSEILVLSIFKLGPRRCPVESRRLWKTCQVTQGDHLNAPEFYETAPYSRCF